ncbi:amidophosphoribosyltransferase [Cytophagales bacterium WSM2-2]|nr:amidophosphoribosyltransferase [Cytophagales bacterium WSM2-2]
MNHNPVWEKFLGRLPLKDAWAFLRFRKEGIVQHLLHQLKYANHPEIGIRLGMLFGKELKDNGITDFDLIIPLPLHPAKQRKRGYNQSTKLAEGISALLEVPYDDRICKRVLNTVTQTQKTKSQRWENVNQAFSVSNPSAIEGKKLLLVDDVITTGATLEACGQTLFSCGAKELSIACIAEAQ